MLDTIPVYLSLGFGATTLLSLLLFYRVISQSPNYRKKAPWIKGGLLVWATLQMGLTLMGFFNQGLDILPPRFLLLIGPAILLILVMFVTSWGRRFMDDLHLPALTQLHVVRIPVELVLYGLFQAGTIPQLMTFEGRNPDILAGITAPAIAYLVFKKQVWGKQALLIWNLLCLALLLNIVIHAILSLPVPFQQLAFDQPNRAVLYFPFSWLPGIVVPLVLFSHLVAIRQLSLKNW